MMGNVIARWRAEDQVFQQVDELKRVRPGPCRTPLRCCYRLAATAGVDVPLDAPVGVEECAAAIQKAIWPHTTAETR